MQSNPEFKKKLNVLIVENNHVDRRMLMGMLRKGTHGVFDLVSCASLKETFELMLQKKFDVVLLDLNLQDSGGIETLNRLHQRFPDIPVVINTGAYQDDLGLTAIKNGAQDYLIKGKYLPYGLSKALYYAVERKKGERELEDVCRHLQEAQAQLIQAEKINVVGGLASGIAHEVKNPLATIMYGIDFLRTKLEPVTDDQIELTLQSIRDAAIKANRIIKELLDFASLSSLQKKNQNINETIDQACKLIHHQCQKSGITVVKNYAADIPGVFIDPNRIEQVILDLALNGIYAMKAGGCLSLTSFQKMYDPADDGSPGSATLWIRPGDPVVIVDIEDNGEGIPSVNLEKIFDPFFTTRRAAGGIGLGLSISRTIMHNHKGLISITNRAEGGVRSRLIFRVVD